ncbi:MAG: DUF308 domain-containing protein [Lachnospiraceae bacterium]|nr:DUF308 domain-containing protein [Lachnospiraceae bacterium]
MEKLWKKLKASGLMSGVICAAVGLLMLFWAGMTAAFLVTVFGIVLILIGAGVVFASYHGNRITGPGFDFSFYTGIAIGAVIVLFGIWVLTHNAYYQGLIPRLFGIMMLVSGLSNLLRAFSLKGIGDGNWYISAIVAAVTVVIGIIFISRAQAVTQTAIRILGACLVYNGATNLLVSGRVSHYEKMAGREKEIIDVESHEVK